MRFEHLKTNPLTLKEAIIRIQNNGSTSYQWYPVRNKKKCLLEVGGRNKGELEIKVHVPSIENNKYVVYENGFVKSEYSVSLDGDICYSTFNGRHDLNKEEYINFIDNTDFKKYRPKLIEREIVEVNIEKSVTLF